MVICVDLLAFDSLIYGFGGKMLVSPDGGYYQSDLVINREAISAIYPVGVVSDSTLGLVMCDEIPEGFEPAPLRKLLSVASSEQEYIQLSRAAQLITWHDTHQFCGRCGSKTEMHQDDLARHCKSCDLIQYPRISPCIIVLVRDGDRCLLARSPHFPPGRFSTLAGFIEAGETAEHAVHREVFEEVGIKIKNVQYIESQSWPFPHSLMLGFFADYDSGVLQPDGVEIEEAHWYSKDNMPDFPPSFSISSKLIRRFLDN